MSSNRKLDQSLNSWDCEFRADSNLASRVNRRIRLNELNANEHWFRRLKSTLRALWLTPAAVGAFGLAMVAMGFFGASLLQDKPVGADSYQLTQSYRSLIDPIYRLDSALNASLGPSDTYFSQHPSLEWLRNELNLTTDQYDKIQSLHAGYQSVFEELFFELLISKRRYALIDEQRRTQGVIDFIALYNLLETKRGLELEASQSTERLLNQAVDVLTPEQQERYMRLIRTETEGAHRDV